MDGSAVKVVAVFAVLAILSPEGPVDGCSMPQGWRPPLQIERVLSAEQVMYGRVLRTLEDGDSWRSTYTAEFEVYCIIKGISTPRTINITQAGSIPGMCYATDIHEGEEHIVLTTNSNGRYVGMGRITNHGSVLIDISRACGLDLLQPGGQHRLARSTSCPLPADPDNCLTAADFREEAGVTSRPRNDLAEKLRSYRWTD